MSTAAVLAVGSAEHDAEETWAITLAGTVTGKLYSYGGGGPGAPLPEGSPGVNGGMGWDCSGVVLALLAARGYYPWAGQRLSSAELADVGTQVAWGTQRPFDLACYPGHVVLVLTTPDEEGESAVLSAQGRAVTNGDDPKRRVRIFDSMRYRSDLTGIVRLHRPVSAQQTRVCLALRDLLYSGRAPSMSPEDRAVLLRRYKTLWNAYGEPAVT